MTFLPKLSVSCLFFDNIRPLYLIPLPFLHASLRLTESIKPSTHSPCFSCWQEYCKPENHCISVICLLSAYKQISIRSACLSVPLSLVSPPCPQFPLRRLCARPSAVLGPLSFSQPPFLAASASFQMFRIWIFVLRGIQPLLSLCVCVVCPLFTSPWWRGDCEDQFLSVHLGVSQCLSVSWFISYRFSVCLEFSSWLSER